MQPLYGQGSRDQNALLESSIYSSMPGGLKQSVEHARKPETSVEQSTGHNTQNDWGKDIARIRQSLPQTSLPASNSLWPSSRGTNQTENSEAKLQNRFNRSKYVTSVD